MTRASIADAAEVFRFILAERGSYEEALGAAMRMFAATRSGAVERTPVRPVLEAVCAFYGVSLDALLGHRRLATVARARQVAMSMLVAAGYSQEEAGEHLGHSKGAAQCACRHVQGDDKLRAEAAEIADQVAAQVGTGGARLPVIWPREAVE